MDSLRVSFTSLTSRTVDALGALRGRLRAPTVRPRRRSQEAASRPLILLTGASGYVGGRLLDALLERGSRVRCLARRPESLRSRAAAGVDVVRGDILDGSSLGRALAGVHTAVYLVHSMGSSGSFEEEDRRGARNFADAARAAGVRRIVYLGGLGGEGDLSPHLRSRHEVGQILRDSGLQVIELRASIIIGSGSLSFEMIRALCERLPVMLTPRWVSVPAQPIAIGDLLRYLVAAIELRDERSRIYEIGGADVVTYGDLLRETARQRGLRRWIIPVPVLTPYLSSLWLGLVTPAHSRVGRTLVDSIRHPTVVRDRSARRAFPFEPVGFREAIADALREENEGASAPGPHPAGASASRLPQRGAGTRLRRVSPAA